MAGSQLPNKHATSFSVFPASDFLASLAYIYMCVCVCVCVCVFIYFERERERERENEHTHMIEGWAERERENPKQVLYC